MKHQMACGVFSLSLTVFAGTSSAGQDYNCTVEDFVGFDRADTEFIAKNLQQTFALSLNDKSMVVTTQSEDFKGNTTPYTLARRTFLNAIYFAQDREGEQTLILPKNPDLKIKDNGFFNATISLQSSFFNNTWLLRCA